jgi:uncharacterized membrane-anchored protein
MLAVQRRVGLSVREGMKPISLGYQRQRLDQQQQAQTERKTRLQSEEARYTVILHYPRKKLGMTINEYCLADTRAQALKRQEYGSGLVLCVKGAPRREPWVFSPIDP